MKYCTQCGGDLEWKVPAGDNMHRYVCTNCGFIHYQNPRIIVGCLPVWEEHRILLCKRAIEPRHGLWTLPSGFMENGETAEQGSMRETREEANASVTIQSLHTVFSIPHINQVYLLFRAELDNLDFYPGPESLEVRLFKQDEIPWDEIAFNSVRFSLQRFFEDLGTGNTASHTHVSSFQEQPG